MCCFPHLWWSSALLCTCFPARVSIFRVLAFWLPPSIIVACWSPIGVGFRDLWAFCCRTKAVCCSFSPFRALLPSIWSYVWSPIPFTLTTSRCLAVPSSSFTSVSALLSDILPIIFVICLPSTVLCVASMQLVDFLPWVAVQDVPSHLLSTSGFSAFRFRVPSCAP